MAKLDIESCQTNWASYCNTDNRIQWHLLEKLYQNPQGCSSYPILLI